MTKTGSISELIDDFTFLDDWEDRYRHIIELGRQIPALAEGEKSNTTKVRGCVSQVWLVSEKDPTDPTHLVFRGESDAHIVQGLIAILLSMFNHKTPKDILDIDAEDIFRQLGLDEHLTPQRSNGLASMVKRIRADAEREML